MANRRRTIPFAIFDSVMTRTLIFEDGRQYAHRCDLESLQSIVHYVAEGGRHSMFSLHEQTGRPYIRTNITLEFPKERGCVRVVGPTSYAASSFRYEDVMTKWLALVDEE